MEKNNKKVGAVIIMHPNHNNYGTSLQGFATIKMLESLGFEYEIIRYKKIRSNFELVFLGILFLISGGWIVLKRKYIKNKFIRNNPSYFNNLKIRIKAVNEFKNKYFEPHIHEYVGYKNLQSGSKNYRVIFVGSDQVWTPMSLYSKFYNLMFVDNDIYKFSYASSFGVSKIPFWQKSKTAFYLNRLNKIGVRELTGKKIVEEITNKKATIVADPTLLLNNEQWIEHISNIPSRYSEPYILCYILGNNQKTRNEINVLKKETGLMVVYLRHVDDFHIEDETMGDIAPYDVSPLDFVALIRDASFVCTDSFHSTIFSIIFEKQFLTFYRYSHKSVQNRNSRIDNLLSILGLSDRIYLNNIFYELSREIDYNSVKLKLESFRSQSIKFFSENLKSNLC